MFALMCGPATFEFTRSIWRVNPPSPSEVIVSSLEDDGDLHPEPLLQQVGFTTTRAEPGLLGSTIAYARDCEGFENGEGPLPSPLRVPNSVVSV